MDTFDLDVRNQNSLKEAFEQADNLLMKKYVHNLEQYNIVPIDESIKASKVSTFTRLFKVDRIVYDKNENNQDRLLNVYNSLYSSNGSTLLILDSDGTSVDFYIGTKSEKESIPACQSVLVKSLKGNFPGIRITSMKNPQVEEIVDNLFKTEFASVQPSITAVSGISSIREGDGFVQGLEKIVDAMRDEKYTVIIVADPINQNQIDIIRSGYEALYTQLMPFASTDLNFSENESSAITDSLTKGVSNTISENLSKTKTFSEGSTKSKNTTKQSGGNFGFSFVLNIGKSSSKSITEGGTENWNNTDSEAIASGTAQSTSEQSGSASTRTDGYTRSLGIKLENKSARALLNTIDDQLKRLSDCNNLGMWNCSTYVVANDLQTSKVLASAYQAITRGDTSGIENSALTTWTDRSKIEQVTEYLKKFNHPSIDIGNAQPFVTPGTLISSAELTIAAGLPQKSIPGVTVNSFSPFGREIVKHDGNKNVGISIGKIHHMGDDENLNVHIDCQSLASHTFITGSTGSGKSNTIYQLLTELNKTGVSFLVVEPAKGEYKHIFGNNPNVSVFGTNPQKTQMLKINPFKFPADIHVLEHIDRLIEIFNVCWPMYAAMPAVLKDAIENAYLSSGWNLNTSTNKYKSELYPSFIDVLEEIYNVINGSDFSQEVKSNYIGALATRVKSLTNGINGQIFVSDEIDNEVLFNSNTIVDLSRVASSETKAMIMGILVMKLQEFRISEGGMNRRLRHVTVLEEAHNLLKRTSTEQASESANLLGKAVEMLANSISEMRTYGEGFVIADQSPSILDLSVIRNTNTKIILRLPELADRELVGRAASLNDEQIVELSKLSTGVAAIYQNDWLEPVLCRVEKFEDNSNEFNFKAMNPYLDPNELKRKMVRSLLSVIVNDSIDYNIDLVQNEVLKSTLPLATKIEYFDAIRNRERNINDVSKVISSIFSKGLKLDTVKESNDIEDWNERLKESIDLKALKVERYYENVVIQCLLKEISKTDKAHLDMYEKWSCKMRGGLV